MSGHDRPCSGNLRKLAGERTEIEMSYQTAWEMVAMRLPLRALGGGWWDPFAPMERRTTTGAGTRRAIALHSVIGRRALASQGEQRTLALSLRLAAFWAVADVIGEQPLLLLDDVFSELDMGRAGALGAALLAQVFVTTARDDEVR